MAKLLTSPHEPDGRLFQTPKTPLVTGFLPRFAASKNRAMPHCGTGEFFGPIFHVPFPPDHPRVS